MDLTININNTFRPEGDNAPFDLPCRVLWIEEKSDSVVLISVEAEPKQPWLYSLSSLIDSLREHKIMLVEMKVPDFMLALEDEIPETQKAIRDTSWGRIKDLVAEPGDGRIFQPGSMGSLIQAHAQRLGLQRKTLYRLLYRYWMLGSIRNALLPRYTNTHQENIRGDRRAHSTRPLRSGLSHFPNRIGLLSKLDMRSIRTAQSRRSVTHTHARCAITIAKRSQRRVFQRISLS